LCRSLTSPHEAVERADHVWFDFVPGPRAVEREPRQVAPTPQEDRRLQVRDELRPLIRRRDVNDLCHLTLDLRVANELIREEEIGNVPVGQQEAAEGSRRGVVQQRLRHHEVCDRVGWQWSYSNRLRGTQMSQKTGNYLLNTDGGMVSDGRRTAGAPLGTAAIGVVLRTPRLRELGSISKAIGDASHNVAEYTALIEGLALAVSHDISRLRVYMDSELVVEQMNGHATVRSLDLKALHKQAMDLVAKIPNLRISWVPRELNRAADGLVRAALGSWGSV
jgi:ribonuclease HI